MTDLGFAIVGTGFIAGVVAKSIEQSRSARLAAVSSRKLETAEAFVAERRGTAAVEGVAALEDWLAAMLRLVRPKGRVTLIHRADRLGEILACILGQAGDIRVFPLWPRRGSAAKRIIITARRGVKTPMRLQPGLILHEGDRYTPEADRVLRDGQEITGLWV